MSLNNLGLITGLVLIFTIMFNLMSFIGYKIYKKRLNKDKPKEKLNMTAKILRSIFKNEKPLWLTIAETLTLCITGVLLVATATFMDNYKKNGAIYEEEMSLPISTVLKNESKLLNNESELLADNLKNSKTTLDDYSIILVRFGCEDCYKWATVLNDYKAEHHSYIVYSKSEIGKEIVDKYMINEVPCIIEHGIVTYCEQ